MMMQYHREDVEWMLQGEEEEMSEMSDGWENIDLSQEAPPQEIPTVYPMSRRLGLPVLAYWKRFYTLLKVTDLQATCGAVLMALDSAHKRIADAALKEAERLAGTSLVAANSAGYHKKKVYPAINPKLCQFRGEPMKPSTKEFPVSRESCDHPKSEMAPAGNAHKLWFTCLKCGSRWERIMTPVEAETPKALTDCSASEFRAKAAPKAAPSISDQRCARHSVDNLCSTRT